MRGAGKTEVGAQNQMALGLGVRVRDLSGVAKIGAGGNRGSGAFASSDDGLLGVPCPAIASGEKPRDGGAKIGLSLDISIRGKDF